VTERIEAMAEHDPRAGATAPATADGGGSAGDRSGLDEAPPSDPVLGARDRAMFAALTTLALVAMAAFGAYWLRIPDAWHLPAAYLLASALLLFHVASWIARWAGLPAMRRPRPRPPLAGARVAAVTTFVPYAEPIAMLERTVRAMVAMDVPHDTWVLDEGDEPGVRELCERLGARHFTRAGVERWQQPRGLFERRSKHGNHNAWLDAVGYERYDFVAAFDSDHVPEPGYLARLLGHFRDPRVAFVQSPQLYYNQEASFVARGAAEESYDYYSVHQVSAHGLGNPVLIGSHNIQRVTALREAGGVPAHDADDLVLTHIYRAAGWRGVYVPEILAMGTTPVDWQGYLRQQVRWARSVVDVKLRVLPALAGRLGAVERALGALHGAFYLRALTIPAAYLLLFYLLLIGGRPTFLAPAVLARLAALTLLLALVGRWRRRWALDPARERGVHWRALALQFAKWPFFLLALWRLLLGRPAPYAITRKIRHASPRRIVLWPHWLLAMIAPVVWIVGISWNGFADPVLTIAALVVTLGSAALAATEAIHFPPPYDPALYERRRAEMAEALGAPRE
jgi:cellulose synthase/poly-beta-1,6-N-acetylglucosamine synthase-like glycosyltransferase